MLRSSPAEEAGGPAADTSGNFSSGDVSGAVRRAPSPVYAVRGATYRPERTGVVPADSHNRGVVEPPGAGAAPGGSSSPPAQAHPRRHTRDAGPAGSLCSEAGAHDLGTDERQRQTWRTVVRRPRGPERSDAPWIRTPRTSCPDGHRRDRHAHPVRSAGRDPRPPGRPRVHRAPRRRPAGARRAASACSRRCCGTRSAGRASTRSPPRTSCRPSGCGCCTAAARSATRRPS